MQARAGLTVITAAPWCWDTNIAKYVDAVIDGEIVVGDMINMANTMAVPSRYHRSLQSLPLEHPVEAAALIQFPLGDGDEPCYPWDSRGIPQQECG